MKDHLHEEMEVGMLDNAVIARNNAAILALFAGATSATLSIAPRPGPERAAAKGFRFYRQRGKRALDVILVVLTLPLTAVIVGLCALALWLEGGNPFYRQDRLGFGGRRFSILKLRTMVRDADHCLQRYLDADPVMAQEWATTQKLKNDPRITRVGAILRATSLDELPQFWNVILGEMSLVGPRPMMPEQLELYGNPSIYFALRPGITGFWQVSARNENHFSFRNQIDAQYADRLSLLCDLGVMLRTVGVMVRRTGY